MNTTNRANILIIDDDPEVRSLFSELVSVLGATSVEAADGQAGLQAARLTSPDLILLDVEMPRLDGLSVCRTLKSDFATMRIPIIVITSLSASADRVKGIEAGADDFLTKPINVSEFNARVRSLLRVKKLNDSLESAETVLFTLARAIEAKDHYTQGHTERVTQYAIALGEHLRCSDDELKGLRQGGLLHDIGKVAVPDHILNKPGKLTHEEFLVVKQHPITGFNICTPMKSLAHTLPCIRWHHEKPNGRGYPDGLKGRDIPRVALIMAVVDVYDALTSRRPYKEAMPREIALAKMVEEANDGGLDSTIVQSFAELQNFQ